MKLELDHIALAVTDIDGALGFYRDILGLKAGRGKRFPSQRADTRGLSLGPSMLQLITTKSRNSAIGKYLDRHGPGIHHVALRVSDLRGLLAQLQAAGVRVIDKEPRVVGQSLVAFVHPSSTHGILFELKQPRPRKKAPRRPIVRRSQR